METIFQDKRPLTLSIGKGKILEKPAIWSSGHAFVSEAGVWGSSLEPIKSDTVLPTVRYRCEISLKGACLDAMTRRWATQIRYTIRHITGSITKDLI